MSMKEVTAYTADRPAGRVVVADLPAVPPLPPPVVTETGGVKSVQHQAPDVNKVTFAEVVGADGVVRKYAGGFNAAAVLQALGIGRE